MVYAFDADRIPQVSYMNRNATPSGWKHFSRTAEEYILYLVIKGEMYLEEGGARYCLQAGDALLLEPGKRHQGYRESSCEYYYVHCAPNSFAPAEMEEEQLFHLLEEQRRMNRTLDPFAGELYGPDRLYLPKSLRLDAARMQTTSAAMQRAITAFDSRMDHFKLICALQLLEILLQLSRQYATDLLGSGAGDAAHGERHVQQLLEYINANYTKKMRSEDLAEHMNMNYDYLNRIFKRQMGVTIFKYVDMLRVNKAKELLLRGGLRSREIAEAVGYSDEYRFSKAFKRAEGYSPKRRR